MALRTGLPGHQQVLAGQWGCHERAGVTGRWGVQAPIHREGEGTTAGGGVAAGSEPTKHDLLPGQTPTQRRHRRGKHHTGTGEDKAEVLGKEGPFVAYLSFGNSRKNSTYWEKSRAAKENSRQDQGPSAKTLHEENENNSPGDMPKSDTLQTGKGCTPPTSKQ